MQETMMDLEFKRKKNNLSDQCCIAQCQRGIGMSFAKYSMKFLAKELEKRVMKHFEIEGKKFMSCSCTTKNN